MEQINSCLCENYKQVLLKNQTIQGHRPRNLKFSFITDSNKLKPTCDLNSINYQNLF